MHFILQVYIFFNVIFISSCCLSDSVSVLTLTDYLDGVGQANSVLSNAIEMQEISKFKNDARLNDYRPKYSVASSLSFSERPEFSSAKQSKNMPALSFLTSNRTDFSISDRNTLGTVVNLGFALSVNDNEGWVNSESVKISIEQSLAVKKEKAQYETRRELMVAQSNVIDSDQQRAINGEYQRMVKVYLDSALAQRKVEFLAASKYTSDMQMALAEVNLRQGVIDDLELINSKIKNTEFQIELEEAANAYALSIMTMCSEYDSVCPITMETLLEVPVDVLEEVDKYFSVELVIDAIIDFEAKKNIASRLSAQLSAMDVSSRTKLFASYSMSSLEFEDINSSWTLGVSWQYKFDEREVKVDKLLKQLEYENSLEGLARAAKLKFNSADAFEAISRKRSALALKKEKFKLTKLVYDSKEQMKSQGVLSALELLQEDEKVRSSELDVLTSQVELTYQYMSLLAKAGMSVNIFQNTLGRISQY